MTFGNLKMPSTVVLAFLAIGAIIPSSTAFAACQQWDVSGRWILAQDNDFLIDITFQQDGVRLSGTAAAHRVGDGAPRPVKLSGQVNGGAISFTIDWQYGGSIGQYDGSISEAGRLRGQTHDAGNPGDEGSVAKWRGDTSAKCLDAVAATPPRQDPVILNPDSVISQSSADLVVASIDGPTSLQAGLSGSFTVGISNQGNAAAVVELNILFAGKLDQTGQIVAGAGLACDIQPGGSAKVNAILVCTGGQLGSGQSTTVLVQGRGSEPGSGALIASLNNSRALDEASFDNNLGRLDLTID